MTPSAVEPNGWTPPPPPRQEPAEGALRAHSVWLANARQDLLAPVAALLEVARLLVEDVRDRGPAGFLADLEKIQSSGEALLARVDELLDPAWSAARAD